jgi:hypothetical protein
MHTSPSATCPKKLRAARTGAQSINADHELPSQERLGPFVVDPGGQCQKRAHRFLVLKEKNWRNPTRLFALVQRDVIIMGNFHAQRVYSAATGRR